MRSPHRSHRAAHIAAAALALVAAAPAVPAEAQRARVVRAFDNSVTPFLGASSYGVRWINGGSRYRYAGSLTVGAEVEHPLTRRAGMFVTADVAPLADQEAENGPDKIIGDRTFIWRADAGLAWRFKPAAPVFFLLGGGAIGASRPPPPFATGGGVEPEGMVAAGYDGRRHGRWNLRGVYVARLARPREPDTAGFEAKSIAYDWTLQVGLRYTGGASPDESAP